MEGKIMNIVSAEQHKLDMLLTQMGGKVKSIHGLLCFVHFYINDTELFYVYNVNAKDQFYLQKVLPYPVGAGVFSKSKEVIEYIKNDLKQFKNAVHSKNFNSFVNINTNLNNAIHKVEDVFMHNNVQDEKLLQIQKEIEKISQILLEIENESEKIVIE